MITILGYSVQLPASLQFLGGVATSFVVTMAAWVVIALIVYFLFNNILRWFARRMSTDVVDIVLEIVRRPLIILTISFGLESSLRLLPLPQATLDLVDRLFSTVLVSAIVYLLWRIIRDVVVYYGTRWAEKIESRVDDILIPILNLFGPLIVALAGVLIILPLWGINITSVLVGAGILGLVLGLALQETLSNVFSGISLLVEAPFRTRDLIVLPDGKLCEVVRIGVRSTELYSLDEHSTVYVPNKTLSTSIIVNITKPTFEQKVAIEVSVPATADMVHVREVLRTIGLAHPNVLAADSGARLPQIREQIGSFRHRAKSLDAESPERAALLDQAAKYEQAIQQLDREGKLNRELIALAQALQKLAQMITGHEEGGFSTKELKELYDCCIADVESLAHQVVKRAEAWSAIADPWATADEVAAERALWEERNEHLLSRWRALHEALSRPSRTLETRLDDMTSDLMRWLEEEYKLLPDPWKNPDVTFKSFGTTAINLQLWFYIDNIRMEHYGRSRRVTSEVAREVREALNREGY
jgi:small-conductance mechanosensitive channel